MLVQNSANGNLSNPGGYDLLYHPPLLSENHSHSPLTQKILSEFLGPENYLQGEQAEICHNQLIYLAHDRLGGLSYHDWLIIDGPRDTKLFYRGKIGEDGIWRGRLTKRKQKRRIETGPELTGDDIRAIAAKQGNGVWYIPRAPFMAPLADSCFETNLITAEWDTQDPDPTNWVWLTVLAEFDRLGMAPNSITTSGGKCQGFSPHAQWFFNRPLAPMEITYIPEILVLLGADPGSVQKRMSQFRKPGFFRHSKGKCQGLFKETHTNFVDLQDWVNVAIQIGAGMDITIPSPQDWGKTQAEKAEQAARQTPDDLGWVNGDDLDRLLTEIDQECPAYTPGGNTYPYRLKLAGAIYTLVGDRGNALCPNILGGASFGNLRANNHPIGTIVNQTRLLLGNPEWQLPDWWQKAQQAQISLKLWEDWRKTKEFMSQIKLNQQYVDFQDFQDQKIYFIKSGLGSGKTTNIRAWIEANREWLHHNRLHFQGYRNNLLLQNCEGIPGLIHIHQFGECDFITDPALWAAYCLDSLLKFQPEDFDEVVIVIDEVVSVIKHLLFAKTEIAKYREKAIKLFIEAIKRARMVICLDGNLADWVVKFFESIDPSKEITTIENTYQAERPELFWLTGGLNKLGQLCPNDYKPLIDRILNPAILGAKAVTSDSQTALETIDSLLTKSGKITFRIDSKTSGTEEVKAFLANPTQWLTANPIDYLLYSPTAESGLDVPITDYFTAHYCLFFGVLDVDSTLQQIARIRDIHCPKYFWAREWSSNLEDFRSPIAEILARVTNERLNLDLHRSLSGEINGADIIGKILETYQTPFRIFEDTAFYLQAQRNFERGHYRQALLERAKRAGYTIIEIEPTGSEIGKAYKAEKEGVLRGEAEKIFHAEVRPVNKLNPDKLEDQRVLKKINLLDQLPGIDYDPIWSEDFVFTVLFKESQLLTQARRAWFLAHSHVAHRLEQEKFKRIYDRFFEDHHSLIWTDRNEWGKIWALGASGILAIISHPDPDKIWGPHDPEIQNILNQCNRKAIYLHLGRQGKAEPMQYIGRLLKLMGAKWEAKRVRDDNGDLLWEYRLKLDQAERPEWQAITASLDRKWGRYIDTELAPIDWAPPEVYLENQSQKSSYHTQVGEASQKQAGQGFKSVPPSGGGLYSQQGKVEQILYQKIRGIKT